MSIPQKNKFTIITVIYKNEINTLKNLIKSIEYIKNFVQELIIISNDSTHLKLKNSSFKIRVITNKANLGFSKAVNIGIIKSKTDIVLLLNPDTRILDKSPIYLYKNIKNSSDISIIGGKMIRDNDLPYFSATNDPRDFLTAVFEFSIFKRIFPNNRWSNKFWIEKNKNITKPIEVTSVCGGYSFIRKKINNNLNLFDERFFLYFEDIDICIKQKKLGYKVIFDPRSTIYHEGGASSKYTNRISLQEWYKSRLLFFSKHLDNFLAKKILTAFYSLEIAIINTLSRL